MNIICYKKSEMLQKLIYINMDVCEYYYTEMSQTQIPHVFINL